MFVILMCVICSLLPDMDRCIRRGMYDCDPSKQRLLTGRLNGHHYICDHLNGIIARSVCDIFYERQYSPDFP